MAKDRTGGDRLVVPSRWQDWQQWAEGVDWSDWRSWLQFVASADWMPGQPPGSPWELAPQVAAVSLTLRAFEEDEPGDQIREHLGRL